MSDTTTQLFALPEQEQEQTPNIDSLAEQIKAKIVDEIFSTNNIDMKTDLNQKQINAITKGKLYAEHFGSKLMLNLCNLHETLLISKSRAGRKEFIELTKNVLSHQEQVDFTPTIKERLLG
jgi:hypothetical protein